MLGLRVAAGFRAVSAPRLHFAVQYCASERMPLGIAASQKAHRSRLLRVRARLARLLHFAVQYCASERALAGIGAAHWAQCPAVTSAP